MKQFYITHKDRTQKGPFTHEDLWRLRETGTISDQTLVWETGTPGWVPLAEILNGKKVDPAPQPILRHQTGKRPKRILPWLFWGTIVTGVAGYASHALHLFPERQAKEEQVAIKPWTEEEKQVFDGMIRKCEGSPYAELLLAIRNGADVNRCDQSEKFKGRTALMDAAQGGHTDIVRILLDKGANPNACLQSEADKGVTALMWAAGVGHTDIVRILLDKGANPNACDQSEEFKGQTALIFATAGGRTDIVRMLLDKGANPNACLQSEKGKGQTALMLAAEEGRTDIVRMLLDKGANPNACFQSEKDKGVTALMWAAGGGHTDIVRILLDKGANPNACRQAEEDKGVTALIFAAQEGHTDIVRMLLDKGVNPNACVQSGKFKGGTALMQAANQGHVDSVRILLDKGADPNAYLQSDDYTGAICRVTTANGEEISSISESEGSKGATALILASGFGFAESIRAIRALQDEPEKIAAHTEIVRLLLEKGADPNARIYNGDTALMRASYKGRTDIVRLLLNKGADPNACIKGETALAQAAREGHTSIVRMLLDKNANPNISRQSGSYKGFTALMWSVGQGHTDIVRMLLDKGVDPNFCNLSGTCKGETALMRAVQFGHTDIVRMLLNKGANPNSCIQLKAYQGITPLMIASGFSFPEDIRLIIYMGSEQDKIKAHTDIVRMLLDKGADPNAKIISGPLKGQTAIEFAARNNHTEIVRLLQSHGATPVPQEEYAPSSQPSPSHLDSRFFPSCFSPLPSTLPGILSDCLKQMESAPDNISDDDRVLLRKTATALKQLLESLDRVDKAVTDGTAAMQEAAQMDRRAQNSPEQTTHRLMVQADGKREQARDTWRKATSDYRKALQTIETLGQSMLAQNREREGKALLRTVEEFREKDRDAEEARKEQKRQQAPDAEDDVHVPTPASPARRKARDISGWGF